jgi:hypothetical protein
VKIHGFPFLTQLLRQRFSDIEVTVDHYRNRGLEADHLDVHLHGASIGLGDVTSGSGATVPVKHIDGVARLDYSTLNRLHNGLSFAYAGANQVRVTGSVTAGGVAVQASATGRVALDGDGFSVAIGSVSSPGNPVGSVIDAAIRRTFAVHTSLPSLPFSITLKSVRATSAGIEVSASADNVTLSSRVG